MTVLSLEDVRKTVNEVEILKDIKVDVLSGEFLSIIGPSGSGKSSLLYIMGLLDAPSEGDVYVEGRRVDFKETKEIAELRNLKFGFVFQFHYLISELTLLENVMIPMLRAGKGKLESKEKAYSILERLGLKGKENRRPYQISGGEQQRVAIARALANDPLVILADEPTGNLDSKNTEIVMEIFCSLHNEGKTVVMVTHEIDLTQRTDRILRMRDGMIVEEIIHRRRC